MASFLVFLSSLTAKDNTFFFFLGWVNWGGLVSIPLIFWKGGDTLSQQGYSALGLQGVLVA